MWLQTVVMTFLLFLCVAEFSGTRAESNADDDTADIDTDLVARAEPVHLLSREKRALCSGWRYICYYCYYYCYSNGVCYYYCYYWCSNDPTCRSRRKRRDESSVLNRIARQGQSGDNHGHVAQLPYSFEYFDLDGGGKITIEEFCKMSPNIQGGCGGNMGEGVHKAFERGDTDGNGYIDREEFAKWPMVFAGGKPKDD